MYKITSRIMHVCVLTAASLAATVCFSLPNVPTAMAAEMAPVEVDATYKITLNGFELGNFRFNSDVTRDHYALNTDVELSALLGVFHWKGVTRSSGTIASSKPQPAGFLFQYESSATAGSIKMGFDADGVNSVSAEPVAIDTPDTVPLTQQSVKNVLDPLSAIMVLTHVDAPTPCGRKVAIFDGRQRFDLDLKFARNEALAGLPGETAIVCRVKYTPIAGYRPTDETRDLAASNGIEIAFRSIPQAKLMLPQTVVVPTAAGRAELTLTQVSVRAPNRGELASVD